MISAWSYRINQWKIGQRLMVLFLLLFFIGISNYLFLYQPLVEKNNVLIAQHAKLQKTLQELILFKESAKNFIYQRDIQSTQVPQVIQQTIAQTPRLTVKNFDHAAPITVSTMTQQFTLVQRLLAIALRPVIQQSTLSMTFSGDFASFLRYLEILQKAQVAFYFEGLDFKMTRYPTAAITMQTFTLGV